MKKKIFSIITVLLLAVLLVACKKPAEADKDAPVISGHRNIEYVIGQSATPNYLEGVIAMDAVDGNVSSRITVDSSAVDLTKPGTYTVKISVTDLSGNKSEETITVTVLDKTAPVITGITGLVYIFGDPAPDYKAGLTATDNVDGDLTASIVVDSSEVKLDVAGVYQVTFQVTDKSGNVSALYSTFIQVKEHADDADLLPPVLNGYSDHTFEFGVDDADDFDVLDGVTAVDNVDGDVTDAITADLSAVDFTEVGVYDVIIRAEDSEGNVASVTIKVTVQKTTKPTLTVPAVYEHYLGEDAPNWLSMATASDIVDGDLTAEVTVDTTGLILTFKDRYEIEYSVTDSFGNTTVKTTVVLVVDKPEQLEVDLDAVYRSYTSGASNLNPYSETLATASDLFDFITDSLYTGDYDWAAARQQLVDEGESDLPAVIGFDEWYAAGKSAAELPYNRFPRMAAAYPVDMSGGEGTKWQIELRQDLKFEDGTPIDADTFVESWKLLLDPLLLNDRATNLYDSTSVPIKGAEAYFKQNGYKEDKLGFSIYLVGDKTVAREYSYSHEAGGYDYYHAEVNGEVAPGYYTEYYGPSYASYFGGNWALTDEDGKLITVDANGNYNKLPDGSDNPAFGDAVGYVQKVFPAFYVDNGEGATPRYTAAALTDGVPTGGERVKNDPVDWETVGIKKVDDYKLELELYTGKTAWDLMGQLSSAITGVVHLDKFNQGMNESKTQTDYGTIDNPLVSYGPFTLKTWEPGVLYYYEINPEHYAASEYRIRKIRFDVIEDQSVAIDEFKAGRLDVVGVGGNYFNEFQYNRNLKLTPATTFFRFAFNIETRPGKDAPNAILANNDFRQAFYFAIDRETFASDVRKPSLATQGFIGPVYVATEYGSVSYRASDAAKAVLADYAPDTLGFDPVKAKELFDQAYAAEVAEGRVQEGETVKVEYQFYNVETNVQVANWVKSQVEEIFNDGESFKKFELVLSALSSDALDQAWDNFDFDMTFGGWQGLNFNPASLIGQVYNSISGAANMLEHGFDTGNAPIVLSLPNTKVALDEWITEFETDYAVYLAHEEDDTKPAPLPEETPSDSLVASYNAWKDAYELFGKDKPASDDIPAVEVGEDEILTTLDELFKLAYGTFYNVRDVNYEGKNDDFNNITAAMEAVLLDQMIAIPLMTSVSSTVYTTRVVFEADSYHAWMGWGGFKYMYLGK